MTKEEVIQLLEGELSRPENMSMKDFIVDPSLVEVRTPTDSGKGEAEVWVVLDCGFSDEIIVDPETKTWGVVDSVGKQKPVLIHGGLPNLREAWLHI